MNTSEMDIPKTLAAMALGFKKTANKFVQTCKMSTEGIF